MNPLKSFDVVPKHTIPCLRAKTVIKKVDLIAIGQQSRLLFLPVTDTRAEVWGYSVSVQVASGYSKP